MSETIHAFGPNGERSRGAQIALEGLEQQTTQVTALADRLEARLASIERRDAAPIFGSLAEAQAWEAANPGRIALWWDSGYTPPITLAVNFTGNLPDLYATTLEGRQWAKGLMGAFGTSAANMTMSVADGFATHNTPQGAGAVVQLDSHNMDLEINYDLLAPGTPGVARQARLAGRGDPSYAVPGGRPSMPVMVAVRYDGQIMFDPWIDPADGAYRGFVMGTGAPAQGTLRLVLNQNQAFVFLDGAPVGEPRTLEGPQLQGTWGGFGVYQQGRVSRFEVST